MSAAEERMRKDRLVDERGGEVNEEGRQADDEGRTAG
jgi:hypothetical protein